MGVSSMFYGALESTCVEERVEHLFSAPYTTNSNCCAERMWQTLMGKVRTMLRFSGLDWVHWWAALKAACFTYNRTPRKISRKVGGKKATTWTTPYYMAYKVRPDLTMLRVWGCLAYTYLPKAPHRRIGKFSDRAHVGYFVGVSRYIRGWDIYVPSLKQYVSSRHVRFDETRYYGGGTLDPEAKGCYSHPSEYLELDNTMADATGENELPVEDHRGLLDASASEPTTEVELLDATVNQERCRIDHGTDVHTAFLGVRDRAKIYFT